MLSVSAFDERVHLAWVDVAVDQISPLSVVRMHLKTSKCDQFGKGVDIYLGRTAMMFAQWWKCWSMSVVATQPNQLSFALVMVPP